MTAGRNDPCPCGSGKKYKKCCMDSSSRARLSLVPPPEPGSGGAGRRDAARGGSLPPPREPPPPGIPADGLSRRGTHAPDPSRWEPAWEMRRAQERVESVLFDFGRNLLGPAGLQSAIEEFTLHDESIEVHGPEAQLFSPWLLYTHLPAPAGGDQPAERDPARTLGGLFLARRGYAVGALERAFVRACIGAVPSFFEVVNADPGSSMRLRDILLGAEHDVAERSGSTMLQRGDVIYGCVVPFAGFALMVGSGSAVLGTKARGQILAFRKHLRERHGEITSAILGEMEEAFRSLYFDMREAVLNPLPLVVTNTDGDPIELHEIHYEIDDPERAFQGLRTLVAGEPEADLRQGATTGRDGRIREIEFPWLKRGNRVNEGWDNTVLGTIRIRGKKLTVEVNSAKRARRIRSLITRRLGDEARYLRTKAQSVESAMRKRRRRSPEEEERAAREREDLMKIPEISARIERKLEEMYADWPDHPLPALDGRTPREAMDDPEGREMVEALLTDFERAERRSPPGEPAYEFDILRRRLGLPARHG